MNKQHGPAFRKQIIELVQCPACRGGAVIEGVFHEMACIQCNASGWLTAATGGELPLEELVTQLNMRMRFAQAALLQLSRPAISGPAVQYEQNNHRGAGGTNYTGD